MSRFRKNGETTEKPEKRETPEKARKRAKKRTASTGGTLHEDRFTFGTTRTTATSEATATPSLADLRAPDPFAPPTTRYGFDVRSLRLIVIAVVLVVCLIAAIIVPNYIISESHALTFSWFVQTISDNMSNLLEYFTGDNPKSPMQYKFFRYIIVAIAGAALGISGAVYQGSMKNALASPTTLGVMSGGTVGMVLYILFVPQATEVTAVRASEVLATYAAMDPVEYFLAMYGQALCTLAGCLIVVSCVVGIATAAGHGRISSVVLIVTGLVFSTLMNSVITVIRYFLLATEGSGSEKVVAMQNITARSFSSMYTWLDVLLVGVPIIICLIVVLAMRSRMNALTFGEAEARSMGLTVNRTRNALIAACTVMTAIIIAFCGSIGFVGFVVPHLTRRIVGPDFKFLLGGSALLGAAFMVVVYFAGTSVEMFATGGTRLLTGILGGVMFVAISLSSRRRASSDGF